jgi:hypothetical protein
VDRQPDIVLTEPVGSCTDLQATVLKPLRHLHGDRYELGPLTVLCKPEHGLRILRQHASADGQSRTFGFSPQAAYLFRKQLEEAQLLVLNKVDKLSAAQRDELLGLLGDRFPGRQVLVLSSRTGEGYPRLLEALAVSPPPSQEVLAIDYNTYAQGEAELGWLNGIVEVSALDPRTTWELDACLEQLADRLRDALLQNRLEPGHLKLLVSSGSHVAIVHWVASDVPVEFSVRAEAQVASAQLLINARVACVPDLLTRIVQQALADWASSCQLTCTISQLEHLRPGRPVPVYRIQPC